MNTNATFKLASVHLILLASLAATIPFLSGCKTQPPRSRPRPLTLNIQPAGQAATLTIPVYIGAANQFYDKALLEDPVDDILKRIRPGDLNNLSAVPIDIRSFQLAAGGTNISRLDPIWSIWLKRKRDHVVVIADLPKNFGGENRRRVAIPLDKRLWRHLGSKKKRTVQVEIHEAGVKLLDTPGF